MSTEPAAPAALGAAFAARFAEIAATRMQGVPVLNAQLSVEALGFAERHDARDGSDGVLGLLITPWFMNLLWLPRDAAAPLAAGAARERRFGERSLSFVGAADERLGAYESCSLFSPMFEFPDQASARATAEQVLALLAEAPPPAPLLGRRALLFGRLRSEP